jgi:hypothetical protein
MMASAISFCPRSASPRDGWELSRAPAGRRQTQIPFLQMTPVVMPKIHDGESVGRSKEEGYKDAKATKFIHS